MHHRHTVLIRIMRQRRGSEKIGQGILIEKINTAYLKRIREMTNKLFKRSSTEENTYFASNG